MALNLKWNAEKKNNPVIPKMALLAHLKHHALKPHSALRRNVLTSLIPITRKELSITVSRNWMSELKHVGIAALTVNRSTVQKHVVEQISHRFTADTALKKRKTEIQYASSLKHVVICHDTNKQRAYRGFLQFCVSGYCSVP